jgi:hypothetical protein
MLTNMLLIGLVLSVSARRRNYGLGRWKIVYSQT